MLVIKNNAIPFKGFKAITLFGVVFTRKELDEMDRVHERIHIVQQTEMLFIPFFVWYILEYLFWLMVFRDYMLAYHSVSFEREAYIHEDEKDYLERRKPFSWIKYVR